MTCDYKIYKNSNLKRHMVTHEAKAEPPAKKVLHCMTCDYKTNKNSHLKRHIKTHEAKEEPPAKKIQCDQCS